MNTELYGQLLTVGNVLVNASKYDEMLEESKARLRQYSDAEYNATMALEEQKKKVRENFANAGYSIFFLPAAIIVLIYAVICWSKFRKYRPEEEKRIEKLSEEYMEQLKIEGDICKRIKREKAEFLKSQTQILAFLPADYQNLHAVGFMLTAIKNCRADTLKEAINLYESELQRMAMMDEIHRESQKQMMQAETLAMALEEIAQNQEAIDSNLDAIRRQQYFEYLHK